MPSQLLRVAARKALDGSRHLHADAGLPSGIALEIPECVMEHLMDGHPDVGMAATKTILSMKSLPPGGLANNRPIEFTDEEVVQHMALAALKKDVKAKLEALKPSRADLEQP